MRTLILASAALLAAGAPATASAQAMPQDMSQATMQQQAAYDGWPADRKQMYDAWPPEVRTYFWTLTPAQQNGWWLLNDDQRTRIYAMTPPQRVQAWNSIAAQLAGSNAGMMASSAGTMGSTGNMAWVSNPMIQPIAGDQAVYGVGVVPVCEEDQYDNCMNPWEAGVRGPSVERPLEYWPGESWNPGDVE